MKPRFLFAAVAVMCVSQPSIGWAQVASGTPAFLTDPRIGEGLGVKTGDFELHPGIAGEAGYDSNYFLRSDTTEKPVIDAYRLRVVPSLSFRTMARRSPEEGGGPPPSLAFHGDLAAAYNALFAANSAYSDQVTKQDHISGTAGLGLDILPERPWGGDVMARYMRTVEASNDPSTSNAWRRDTVEAAAGVIWRPGGGLFRWRLGYDLRAQLFEEDAYQNLNNLQHRIDTEGRWKFLPRTALVYQGDVSWLEYVNNAPGLSDGEMLHSLIGVNGLVTNYLGILAVGGWGATFFKDRGPVRAENYDGFIGQAEATWYLSPQTDLPEGGRSPGLSSLAVGYHRTYNASYLGNYFVRDRGYASAVFLFGEHVVFSLQGGFSHITRPPSYFANDGNERPITGPGPTFGPPGPENRLDALAFLEYRPMSALGINATFRYDAELNDRLIHLSETDPNATDNLEFKRYQVYLGVRWFL